MSKDKQTFTDPKTGEEVESTWWARWGGGLLTGWGLGLIASLSLLLGSLISDHLGLGKRDWGTDWGIVLWTWLAGGLGVGLMVGLGFNWLSNRKDPRDWLYRWGHDVIARSQHRRRILRSQEGQDVPATALSRAQPPGEPTPTDAALSVADEPDEPGRLSVSEDTAETTVEQTP